MTSSIEKAAERLGGRKADPEQGGAAPTAPQAPGIGAEPGAEGALSERDTLCRLDFETLRQQGYLTPNSTQSQLAEEMRLLKRPLLRNAFGKGAAPIHHGNLIAVTSALPGEGKTFTTLNLAMSMAMEMDTTVLMVDSDVVKPSLTRLLRLEEEPGLTDVLAHPEMDLGSVIVPTDLPKLRVVPAGRRHSHSTELLASEQMEQVAFELSRRYPDRVVLFDAPPLLVTSQAGVLSSLVGQVLVVVEAGRTSQSAVKEAVSHLDQDKVIGMVLNKGRRGIGGDYYYGGYYGSYGE